MNTELHTFSAFKFATIFATSFALASCSATPDKNVHNTTEEGWQSVFVVPASDWSSRGTNPYFVLEPGHTMEFADKSGKEHLTITVTDKTRIIDGVETRLVVESEMVGGKPKEISRNYFAISKSTNDVYYFGEDVDMYKNGVVTSHDGSWISGVNGAKFGLFMPGKINIGAGFYQELAPGVAMDRFKIKSTAISFDTPAGHFDHCLQIEETTPLEPDSIAIKLYAPSVGLLQDGDLLLVSHGMNSAKK